MVLDRKSIPIVAYTERERGKLGNQEAEACAPDFPNTHHVTECMRARGVLGGADPSREEERPATRLIGVVKLVIHEPGDNACLSHTLVAKEHLSGTKHRLISGIPPERTDTVNECRGGGPLTSLNLARLAFAVAVAMTHKPGVVETKHEELQFKSCFQKMKNEAYMLHKVHINLGYGIEYFGIDYLRWILLTPTCDSTTTVCFFACNAGVVPH